MRITVIIVTFPYTRLCCSIVAVVALFNAITKARAQAEAANEEKAGKTGESYHSLLYGLFA